MFDKLKQFKELHSFLKDEKATIEEKGIKIVINGNLEIEEIKLNPELSIEEQEKILEKSFNQGIKKIQMIAASKMSQMNL